MAWFLLGIAGVLEIGFAIFMKASEGFTRLTPSLLTVATGVSSVVLLSIALRSLPVGPAMPFGPGSVRRGRPHWACSFWAKNPRQPGSSA